MASAPAPQQNRIMAFALAGVAVLVTCLMAVVLLLTGGANSQSQIAQCENALLGADGIAAAQGLGEIGSGATANAQAIITVGQRMGMSEIEIVSGLATGLVESNLRNLANSNVPESLALKHEGVGRDHDSVGVMQQRVQYWGPARLLINPAYAAAKYFTKLRSITNRRSMTPGQAAQAVQQSAYPDKYDVAIPRAQALYSQLAGSAAAASTGDTPDVDAAVGEANRANSPNATPGSTEQISDQDTLSACAALSASGQLQKITGGIVADSEAGARAVQAAQTQIGLPYVWGGGSFTGPTGGGFDCSGLTRYALYQGTNGRSALPRTTYEQIKLGTTVADHTKIRAGDLVFSNFSNRGPEHVALAISPTQVIEAQTFGVPVKVSPLPAGADIVVKRVLSMTNEGD